VLSVIGKQNQQTKTPDNTNFDVYGFFACLFCLPITDNTNFDIYGVFVCLFCLPKTDNTNFDIYGVDIKISVICYR
jgi:hypothetical protein